MRQRGSERTGAHGRERVTRRIHTEPWTADLERDVHADNRQLVVGEAIDAIEQTEAPHLDLVTHGEHGNPAEYLSPVIDSLPQECLFEVTDRCPCGGYVVRVRIGPTVSRHESGCQASVRTRR